MMYNNLEYIQNEGPVYLWRIKSTGDYRVSTPNSINTFKNRNDAEDVYRYYVPVYREIMENKGGVYMTLFKMIRNDYIRAICIGARHSGMIEVIDMYTSCLPRDRMIGWHSEVERDLERINVLLSEYPVYVIGGVV